MLDRIEVAFHGLEIGRDLNPVSIVNSNIAASSQHPEVIQTMGVAGELAEIDQFHKSTVRVIGNCRAVAIDNPIEVVIDHPAGTTGKLV